MGLTQRHAPAAWVGIDVSQHTLDACLLQAPAAAVAAAGGPAGMTRSPGMGDGGNGHLVATGAPAYVSRRRVETAHALRLPATRRAQRVRLP